MRKKGKKQKGKMKILIAIMALMVSAVGTQAGTGYDLIMRLNKISSTQLGEKTSIVPNGLTTHRFVLYGPEAIPSKHITPLGTSANFIVAGAPPMGSLTYVGSKFVGSGGYDGKLRKPVRDTSREVIQEGGVNYVRTITTYADGTLNMTMAPEANGVLQEQAPQPMGAWNSRYGNLSITVNENGGSNNGTSTTYNAAVPFMNVNSAVSVMHIAESNSYIVQSYQITLGGATISCNLGSLSITIDWFKDAKDH